MLPSKTRPPTSRTPCCGASINVTTSLRRFGHEVGKLEPGRYADILVVNGDPLKDIRLLQNKSQFDFVFKGGKAVDLTPPAPIRRWYFEKHKIFLNGLFTYDEQTGGHLVS